MRPGAPAARLLAFLLLTAPGAARASGSSARVSADQGSGQAGDGAYGRLDGDLEIAPRVGVVTDLDGVGPLFGVSAFLLSSAGLSVLFAPPPGSLSTRSVSGTLALKPLFLPRFALDLERGPAWFDLTLDSLTFGIGAYAATAPGGTQWDRAGLSLELGIGAPIGSRADGLWIEFGGWLRPGGNDAMHVALSWHGFFVAVTRSDH